MTRNDRHALSNRRWRLGVLRRRGFVRWLLVFAALVMLGQQSAMAAYACELATPATASTTTVTAMSKMDHGCADMQQRADQTVCRNHCATTTPTPTETHVVSVPPSSLTPLPPAAFDVVLRTCAAGATPELWYRQSAAPPLPPRLLFCSLQI